MPMREPRFDRTRTSLPRDYVDRVALGVDRLPMPYVPDDLVGALCGFMDSPLFVCAGVQQAPLTRVRSGFGVEHQSVGTFARAPQSARGRRGQILRVTFNEP